MLKRWNNKRARDALQQPPPQKEYDFSAHMDWIDESNHGTSHFGLHPDDFPIESARCDVFHLRCAATRRLMNNLRKFMMKQSVEIMETFSDDVLSKIWPDYHVLVWNLNKSFQQFNGGELLQFIKSTQLIVDFLKKTFRATDLLTNLCKGLLLWEKITPFLVITKIGDKIKYNRELKKFKRNVKQFYKC